MAASGKGNPGGRGGHALEKSHDRQRKGNGELERQGLVREDLPFMKDGPGRASKRKKRRRGR